MGSRCRVCVEFLFPVVFRPYGPYAVRMERFEMKVSGEWLAVVDLARGSETRSGFVRRLVEGALGGAPVEAVAGTQEARQAVRAVAARPAPAVTSAEDLPASARPAVAARDAAREKAGLPPAPRFNVTPSKWSS